MPLNTLTDSAIKAVKATDKPVKLFDGAGLRRMGYSGEEMTWHGLPYDREHAPT